MQRAVVARPGHMGASASQPIVHPLLDSEEGRLYVSRLENSLTSALVHVLETRPELPILAISTFLIKQAQFRDGSDDDTMTDASNTVMGTAGGTRHANTDPADVSSHRFQRFSRNRQFSDVAKASTREPSLMCRQQTMPTRRRTPNDIFLADDIFDTIDRDHNGVLSVAELWCDLRDRGYPDVEIRQLVSNLDMNDDGVVTRDEWRAGFYIGLPVLLRMVPPAHMHIFDCLHPPNAPALPLGTMETAERGISVRQLRAVFEHVQEHCVADRWTNVRGELIAANHVTLYDLVRYVIKPSTVSRRCSYVELVATEAAAQRPRWFVSHWWGHQVVQMLRCIEQHAHDHGYDEDAATYWVCAFAINQHDALDDVRRIDPSDSSFARAIEVAEGRVLSIIDADGITLSRIWCCLEIFLGLAGTYDIYAPVEHAAAYDLSGYDNIASEVGEDGYVGGAWLAEVIRRLPIKPAAFQAVGLTDGPAAVDSAQGVSAACQTFRQSHFPVELIRRVSELHVQDTTATVSDDKRHILNYIAGRRGDALDQPPAATSERYVVFDNELYAKHVAAGWRLLTEADQDMREAGARLAASSVQKLVVSCRGCAAFTDDAARLLAAALPSKLEELKLECADSRVSPTGAAAVLHEGVLRRVELQQLRVLSLHDCNLEGEIPAGLGACAQLQVLNFAGNQMRGLLPAALRHCTALRSIFLQNNLLSGPLPVWLSELPALTLVMLNGNDFEGTVPEALGRCGELKELRIHKNPRLLGPLPQALGECTALTKLELDEELLCSGLPLALQRRREEGTLRINPPRWTRPALQRYHTDLSARSAATSEQSSFQRRRERPGAFSFGFGSPAPLKVPASGEPTNRFSIGRWFL